MTRCSSEQLAALPPGTELEWVFSTGGEVRRHRALLKKQVNQSLLLHVLFDGVTPEARRWSLITNQPLHQYRGHTGGTVWLEQPLS
jgi:hypothetical protein